MALPYFQSADQILNMIQTKWKSVLDPLAANTLINGVLLTNIPLINGTNIINHKLGRMMQGWIITDVNAGTAIYRSQPMNDKTLTLSSGAICTISLWVF